jgi:hypothetical protein
VEEDAVAVELEVDEEEEEEEGEDEEEEDGGMSINAHWSLRSLSLRVSRGCAEGRVTGG